MAALGMDPSEYEAALQRIHKEAQKTAKQDSDSNDVLLAQIACYAIRELHAKGIPPKAALRAMTILEYAEEKQPTGKVIKQAKHEIRSKAPPQGKPKQLKAGLNTLPEEIRIQILQHVVPEEYHVETYDFKGEQTGLGESQNPALPLLLVNRKISKETASLLSKDVALFSQIYTALEAVAIAPSAKKRSVKLVEVILDHAIDVDDRSIEDGFGEEKRQWLEEGARRRADEMCRRLSCHYDQCSIDNVHILWMDKEILRPQYWESISIKVDGYRRKAL